MPNDIANNMADTIHQLEKELKDLREENKVLISECDGLIKENGELLSKVSGSDVQPVKHGRWTYPYKDKDINQCSECRSCVQDKISNVREMFAYCPFCGARMDLKDGEQND